MKAKTTCFLCVLYVGVSALHAQDINPSTFNASGGSKVIAGNTYEYSIGEMTLINTASGSNIIVTQGLLQPIIQEETGIQSPSFFSNKFKVYPNPSDQVVFLQPDFELGGELSIQLNDMLGRVLKEWAFTLNTGKEKQSINLSEFASSSYSLIVTFKQQEKNYSTTYKIQKIN